jgi:predicted transposase YdaD
MLGTKFQETRVYREAKDERSQEIALKMLHRNMSLEEISDVTDLTVAQLQELQAQVSR